MNKLTLLSLLATFLLVACENESKSLTPNEDFIVVNQKTEMSWSAPSGDDLIPDELADLPLPGTVGQLPQPIKDLNSKLEGLFAQLLGYTEIIGSSEGRGFNRIIVEIMKEDPHGDITSSALIDVYQSLSIDERKEKYRYMSIMGFLVSNNNIEFFEEIGASSWNHVSEVDNCQGNDSPNVNEMMIRIAATNGLYHIATLLGTQESVDALEYILINSQHEIVKISALMNLRLLGYQNEHLEPLVPSGYEHILDVSTDFPVDSGFPESYPEEYPQPNQSPVEEEDLSKPQD